MLGFDRQQRSIKTAEECAPLKSGTETINDKKVISFARPVAYAAVA